ncbi:hypothetical protein H4S07_002865 [Coemansia furcata]|uniref:Uncharacterized protein n=1 Tax=Coemansia furcata TaxID=417177 RepID=A0ACC1LKE3_9FUNG|nr:hypothetical protein H4S07_002865 [Coemansia furcata]
MEPNDTNDTPMVEEEEERRTPLLPSAKEYRLKDIQWRDPLTGCQRQVKIVTQNENGPCPLIALVNVLALSTSLAVGSANKRTTTDEELAGLLANHLLLRTEPPRAYDVGSGAGESVPAEHDVNAVLSLLPTLGKGLDVDLQFAHIYDFAATPASLLFRAFGVDLVHGWVVDPEDDVAGILLDECRNSYDGAVEFILAANELKSSGGELSDAQDRAVARALRLSEWMEDNATQLTDCGLHSLGTMLPENRLCVLFRNNHFSTLYRRGAGELFLLCTDDGVAGDTRIVWETLGDVRQTTARFLDSQFRALDSPREDYVREEEGSAQIDEDYALALRLHHEEEERRRGGALQVRQQDRLPPGMDARGQLYGVPVVTREGEGRLAKAIYRSESDENFARRMTDTFLPHEAAAMKAKQQRPREKPKDNSDRCVIC